MAGPSSDYNVVDGRYVAITHEIEQMAETIKRTFVDARRSYCPSAGGVSKAQWPHFVKAALMCIRLKEDPIAFTLRQVEEMARFSTFYPSALHSDKLSLRGAAKTEQKAVDHLAGYRAQLTLLDGLRAIFTVQEALSDPVNQFSPLFRACLAIRFGLPDVAVQHRESAKLELAACPVARELFKNEVTQL